MIFAFLSSNLLLLTMAKTKSAAQPMYWVFFGVAIIIFSLLLINWTVSIPMWRNAGKSMTFTKENCLMDECTTVSGINFPATKLDKGTEAILLSVLEEEQTAQNLYSKAVQKFGTNRPFSMILRSEEQHVSSVKALFDKYGVAIPEYTANAKTNPQTKFVDTCKQAADLEKAYVTKLEKEVLPKVKQYSDINQVITNILSASKNRHIPAFERCQ